MRIRRPVFIGYAVLVVLIAIAFWFQARLAEQLQQQSLIRNYNLCINQNETREALALVLDTLAAPREDDEPGEFEERQRLRALVDPYVQQQDCPPPPDIPMEDVTPIPTITIE